MFAFTSVLFAILPGFIMAWSKLRRTAAGSFEHLRPIKRQKFLIVLRSPRKCIDPIETKHVIDPKNVKALANAPNALPPPVETSFLHRVPSIKGDAPVLSPLLSELVVLKM